MSLFTKKQPPACEYCRRAGIAADGSLTCAKQGSVEPTHKCRRFVYDPIKRVPPKPLVLKQDYEPDEFKI